MTKGKTEFYKFDPNKKRSEVEAAGADALAGVVGFSAVRKCTKGENGLNEDNGIATVLDHKVEAANAEKIFKDIFAQVRKSKAEGGAGKAGDFLNDMNALDKKALSLEEELKAAKKEANKNKPYGFLSGGFRRAFTNADKFQAAKEGRKKSRSDAEEKVATLKEQLIEAKKKVKNKYNELDNNPSLKDEVENVALRRNLSMGGMAAAGAAEEQKGATTAAGAIITNERVTYAGAGDSVAFLVDDGGNVILLNKLHMGGGR